MATAQTKWLKKVYPGVQARLIMPFLVVSIVIAGIGVFIVTRLVAGSIQERFNNQLLDSARAASNSIVEIERQQLVTLRVMVFTDGVAEAVVAKDRSNLDLWLRPLAANAAVDDLVVFDHAGQTIIRLEKIPADTGIQFDFASALDVTSWPGTRQIIFGAVDAQGDKYADIVDGKRLYISAPVIDPLSAERVGGIAIGLDMDGFAQRISEQSLSAVALYRPSGEVLGHTFRQIDPSELQLTPVQAQLLSLESSFIEEMMLDGRPYQVLFSPFELRDEPVGLLAVGLPSNFIVEQSGTSRNIFGALFAALFMTVGILGMLMARTITRPVARLVDTTRAIRSGDLSRRVDLQTPDELGELGRSFDHMTTQLVKRNHKINSLYLSQLEETSRRDAVLSSIRDPVIVSNTTSDIFLRNQAAEHLIKMTAGNSMLRRKFRLLVMNPEMITEPRTVELNKHFYSVLATPVHMPNGDSLGHVIVFRDITAIIKAEKLKDELMMQMSHELRTPLTAARGYLDLIRMLEAANLTDQGISHVEGASDNLGALERLIVQVEDVSAIIADRFQMESIPCNLSDLLAGQITIWEKIAPQRDITIQLFAPPAEIWVQGDERRLSQIFDHLLRNAYSYTLPGGMIEVQLALNAESVMIYVIDSGVGIELDELGRVFERMYRGRSADAGPTDSSGLGLGLYLSQHIVEAHKGTIELDSKVGQGTVVKIVLPVVNVMWNAESLGTEIEPVAS